MERMVFFETLVNVCGKDLSLTNGVFQKTFVTKAKNHNTPSHTYLILLFNEVMTIYCDKNIIINAGLNIKN